MSYIDYSKTGIFESHTNLETTNKKNAELYAMYQAFYKKMRTEAKSSEVNLCGYNGVQLLTCFDSYLTADNQIMIYGKEAHTDEGCVLDDLSPHYQKKDESDEYYKYEYKIAHVGEDGIAKSDCPHTYYLKTRELIAHFDKNHKPEKREAEILSVLSNNLNKTSLKGKRTECYPPGEPKRKSKKYRRSRKNRLTAMRCRQGTTPRKSTVSRNGSSSGSSQIKASQERAPNTAMNSTR